MRRGYEDMICMPHHVSAKRKKMSRHDRAAQFSPFAALTGHSEAIKETARLTDDFIELTDDEKNVLNENIVFIVNNISNLPTVEITYFVPDELKSGGEYVNVIAQVCKVNQYERCLILSDLTRIPFSCLYKLNFVK